MSRTSIVSIASVTLLAIGVAYWLNAGEPKRPWPKPTPPPPASEVYHESTEPVPTEEEVTRALEGQIDRIEAEIEGALQGGDAQRREAAFVFLLPGLLQIEPDRVAAMVARQAPGAKRDLLRNQVTRLWTSQDLRAAVKWMHTLDDEERRVSGRLAVAELKPVEPLQAAMLAKELGLERDPVPRVTAR
jgi:hypothetical protein